MTRFTLPTTCLLCAGPVTLVNCVSRQDFAVAILECQPCGRQFELTMRLSVHRTPEQVHRADKKARERARQRVMA